MTTNVAETVKTIFDHMPKTFVPEKAKGVKAKIQISLDGEGGGNWLLNIADGRLNVEERKADQPDLKLDMTARDYVRLTLGQTNPMLLFMSGKVKMEGNMLLAWKMQEMFDRKRVM